MATQTGSSLMLYPLPEVRQKPDRPTTFLSSVDAVLDRLYPKKDFS